MSLADAVLSALNSFKDEVATWTNSGVLVSIQNHIAQVEHAVATDVHAGETAAKEVLGQLYGAFHGSQAPDPAPVTPAPSVPVAETPVAPEPAPAPVAAPVAEAQPSSSAPSDVPAAQA